MKIVIFTSNAIRHKFLANTLAKKAKDTLVISECAENDAIYAYDRDRQSASTIEEHFLLRYQTEKNFFANSDYFVSKTIPLLRGEVNLNYVYESVRRFSPDIMFSFGASIIKEPLLSLLLPGHFINLHLGFSPYYKGSGTNFWPFVNKELEYVGATIMHIDAGVDTGDIIMHVRPQIEAGDNVHTVGCKVIKESALYLLEIMDMFRSGKKLQRVRQWRIPDARYYKKSDFNEGALLKYKKNLEGGLIDDFLKSPDKKIRLILLHDN